MTAFGLVRKCLSRQQSLVLLRFSLQVATLTVAYLLTGHVTSVIILLSVSLRRKLLSGARCVDVGLLSMLVPQTLIW